VAVPSGHNVVGFDQNLIQHATKQNGAWLLHHLVVQCQIVDELLSHMMAVNGANHLEVFDEFLIRDAKGWLWKEYKELASSEHVWMKADPAHLHNAAHFGKTSLWPQGAPANTVTLQIGTCKGTLPPNSFLPRTTAAGYTGKSPTTTSSSPGIKG